MLNQAPLKHTTSHSTNQSTKTQGVGVPATVHEFKERLAYSEQSNDEEFWIAAYRRAFPNFVNCMQTTGDTVAQRLGIDRVIALSSGANLRIDEKKRAKEYGDILLEYISVDRTGAPGWIEKDLQIDYVAYGFISTRRVYLLSWPLLRAAWLVNRARWLEQGRRREKGFRLVEAQNKDYKTLSLAIPIPTLYRALNRAAVIDI